MTRPSSKSIELRVNVLLPSGNRTSRKFSHATAAVKFANKVIEKWPGSKVSIDQRECEPFVESLMSNLIPEIHRWVR